MVVAAHAGFVSEHDHCTLGRGAQGRQIVVKPLVHVDSAMRPSGEQRATQDQTHGDLGSLNWVTINSRSGRLHEFPRANQEADISTSALLGGRLPTSQI